MIQKKICMVGSFAVGKTSLVRRFVHSIFADKYLTTVGVKIDKKLVDVDGQTVNLVLWDIAGEDAFQDLQMRYVRGSAGFILVVDGTRPETLDKALVLLARIDEQLGELPYVLALNKRDLREDWQIDDDAAEATCRGRGDVVHTSAKTGEGVEIVFERLARRLT